MLQKKLEDFSTPVISINQVDKTLLCPICKVAATSTKVPIPDDCPFDSFEFYNIDYPCGHYKQTQMEIKRFDKSIAALWLANRLYNKCNLGEKFLEKTFDTYEWRREPEAYQACIKYARGFDKISRGGKGLLLASSQYGNGKTHLAGAIVHEVITRRLTNCIFVRGCDMVDDVQSAKWGRPVKFSIKNYEDCDLLVIDDLAKEGVTIATAKVYWRIIDYRVLNRKPIVLTTNYSEYGLLNACDDSTALDTWAAVVDRLASVCKSVLFNSNSYRRKEAAKLE